MLAKRIIACLDIRDGQLVKGVNFEGIREIGDPVEYAIKYNNEGADEITFLDINADSKSRNKMYDLLYKACKNIFVPLTVGGGVSSVDDVKELLRAGADKVSIGSAAVKNPKFISDAASIFGEQSVVIAIDAKRISDERYEVFINGGRVNTGLELVDWAKKVEKFGAGEILLTSMDTDGTKNGFDIPMLQAVCDAVNIPVIASGGCGNVDDFVDVFEQTSADAALAASIFHYGDLTIEQVKHELSKKNIPVRIQHKDGAVDGPI
ncbi:MAG: imidazole glycerol phosphate synthase subunit HisF [Clostridiales bacterium]|jgi:cyclase|nr:imidazole glycerol phosphate synthase subunit HisF [Clostridiales bacterium]